MPEGSSKVDKGLYSYVTISQGMQEHNRDAYLADWLLCLLLHHIMCIIPCEKDLRCETVPVILAVTKEKVHR